MVGTAALSLVAGYFSLPKSSRPATINHKGKIETSAQPVSAGVQTKARLQEAYGKLPLYFIENRGQFDTQVAYYVQGRDTSVYFTSQGLTFALTSTDSESMTQQKAVPEVGVRPVALRPGSITDTARQRWALKLDFVGANPNVQPTG
jgi:hypothetical protein